jgi:signal transduction histidine kinase
MPARAPLIKVLLVFIVGIILPTGFLVYMGILSIHSETLLLKKESQERVGKTAHVLRDQAQAAVARALAPFENFAKGGDAKPPSHVSMLLKIDGNNHLLYPARELRRQPPQALVPLALEERLALQKAEQMEFKNQDYETAAQSYRALEREVESIRWKIILETNRAGCLLKLRRYDEAQALYEEVLNRHAQEQDPQGYPFGVVIAAQMGDLLRAKERADLARTNDERLLQELISGRWDLSWDETQFFVRHVMERFAKKTPTDSRAQTLMAQWDDLKRSVAQAQNFLASRWPTLQKTLREKDRAGSAFLLLSTGKNAIAYVPVYEPRSGALQESVVAEWDSAMLFADLQRTLEPLAGAAGLAYRLDRPNVDPLPANVKQDHRRWPLHEILTQTDPPLQLSLAPVTNASVAQAAERRRKAYIGMVILAALVILVALYATWYALSREMEVAQLKARFVASISHELKTPLSIIGFIGQKLQLGRYQSQEEVEDYYAMISDETTRLKTLIDEVLDFSRLMENRQPYRKEPTDLVRLAQETAERFRQSQKSDHVRVECVCEPVSCRVAVDSEALSRALLNLLDNAVKYSPPERIHVTLTLQQRGPSAVLQISDEGYGISPEEKNFIFDRFYRGRSASDHPSVHGAGLGLSIVKHIIDAHGGRLELQSTVGKGSIFSIDLPMNGTRE